MSVGSHPMTPDISMVPAAWADPDISTVIRTLAVLASAVFRYAAWTTSVTASRFCSRGAPAVFLSSVSPS
ncbi:hypothetical protein [Streptomyces lavendofoliae]|uniref:hypothetical protein n=1 Tax=Streptomyces lavendofoliae TaxID=67314 RepID=UPI00300E9DDD